MARQKGAGLNARRARLGDRLLQIAASGPCPSTGPRFVLGQNVGPIDRPLWAFLSPAVWNAGQLVFSGNRAPIELSEAQALELAPELWLFAGEVVLRPAGADSGRSHRKADEVEYV